MESQGELHAVLKEMLGAISAGEADSVVAQVRKIDEIGAALGTGVTGWV